MKKRIIAMACAFGAFLAANADSAASYPGGDEALDAYIQENLKYPANAKENGIEGIVHLIVTIQADGSIGTVKVERMIDPDLEQEAIRLVKGMPKWSPATAGDASVESTAKVSIPFHLAE